MDEWLQHHRWQGVDHFYLLDNGSTDNYTSVIGKHREYVTVIRNGTKHAQHEHLHTLWQLSAGARWLMEIDLDEFVYARPRSGHHTIASYLHNLNSYFASTSYIQLYWHMFGSSGMYTQPKSVRQAFTRSAADVTTLGKYIVRRSALHTPPHLQLHDATIKWGQRAQLKPKNAVLDLALNHYAIMSRQRFAAVKMTRGDATAETLNHVRNIGYFDAYDKLGDEINNTELSELVSKFSRQRAHPPGHRSRWR